MKLRTIIVCLVTLCLLGSCKSKKKVVKKQPTPVVVVVEEPQVKTTVASTTEEYIQQFKDIAMREMRIYKIPASITLAQGILESSSGKSPLALRSNNHFGIKCHKEWTGKTTKHDDDLKGECFRVYNDPKFSYEDHSKFLTTRSRYDGLFDLKEDDYVGWAKGLQKAGYATDRRYPAKLIALIEKYGLYRYDKQVLGSARKKAKKNTRKQTTPVVKTSPPVKVKKGSLKSYKVVKGDTLYSLSKRFGMTVEDLKKVNSLSSNALSIGQVLKVKK